MSNIASRIDDLRISKNMSIQLFADSLGISRSAVYKWIHGSSEPSLTHVVKISQLFNTDPNFLLLGELPVEDNNEPLLINIDNIKQEILKACSFKNLNLILSKYIKQLGLDLFFYKEVFRGDLSDNANISILTNIPNEWIHKYRRMNYSDVDPTWEYAVNNILPKSSNDFYKEAIENKEHETVRFYNDCFKNCAAYTVTIPIHGSCNLGSFTVSVKENTKEHHDRIDRNLESLIYIAHHIYDAVERIKLNKKKTFEKELTIKEIKVIELLSNGYLIKQIADNLSLSIPTINSRIERAKEKLNAKNRDHLIQLAVAKNVFYKNIRKMRADTLSH